MMKVASDRQQNLVLREVPGSCLVFPILSHELGMADFEDSWDVVYEFSFAWSCVGESGCLECFLDLFSNWKAEVFLFSLCADFVIG